MRMLPGWEGQVRRRIHPTMRKVGQDIHDDFVPHVDSGEMTQKKFVRIDAQANVEVGSSAEHAIYEELGTSERPAHPTLEPAARKYRGRYNA